LFGHNSTSIYIETIKRAPFTENHVKDSSMFGKVSNVPEELAKWVKRMNVGCALCNKKKNYYRCTHPTPPHPSPPYYIIVIQRWKKYLMD
jgi:hypothetical protein